MPYAHKLQEVINSLPPRAAGVPTAGALIGPGALMTIQRPVERGPRECWGEG